MFFQSPTRGTLVRPGPCVLTLGLAPDVFEWKHLRLRLRSSAEVKLAVIAKGDGVVSIVPMHGSGHVVNVRAHEGIGQVKHDWMGVHMHCGLIVEEEKWPRHHTVSSCLN